MKAYGICWQTRYFGDVVGLCQLGAASHELRLPGKNGEHRGQRGNIKSRVRKGLKSAARWQARRDIASSRD
jgi:hypothetical protein